MKPSSSPPLQFIAISDFRDARLEDYRDIRDRDLQGEAGRSGLFIGEQLLTVAKMLSIPGLTKSVLLTPPWKDRLVEIVDPAECESGSSAMSSVPVFVVPENVMQKVAGFPIHRGVLAAGFRPASESLTIDAVLPRRSGPLTILLCEDVSNIDNIGMLFRNAAAFGVDAVVLSPRCHDPLYRKSLRVSIGHALTVPWARSSDWLRDLDRLRDEWNLTMIAAATTPASVPIEDIEPPQRVGLIVGPEYAGLPESTLSRCDHVARIPMAAGVDSLNVAVAAAVCLHRFSRTARQLRISDNARSWRAGADPSIRRVV